MIRISPRFYVSGRQTLCLWAWNLCSRAANLMFYVLKKHLWARLFYFPVKILKKNSSELYKNELSFSVQLYPWIRWWESDFWILFVRRNPWWNARNNMWGHSDFTCRYLSDCYQERICDEYQWLVWKRYADHYSCTADNICWRLYHDRGQSASWVWTTIWWFQE